MSKESEDLGTHVSLCEQRYKELERRLDHVETRLSSLASEVANLKTQMAQGFSELRLIIERQNSRNTTQIIASAGTVVVALVGVKPAWSASLGAVEFPLDAQVTGSTLTLASSAGQVTALDATTSDKHTASFGVVCASAAVLDGGAPELGHDDDDQIVPADLRARHRVRTALAVDHEIFPQ